MTLSCSAAGAPVAFIPKGEDRLQRIDLHAAFAGALPRLPHVLRLLAENALRTAGPGEASALISAFTDWLDAGRSTAEIAFLPARIMMHDTTCGPALVDIAAMRDVLAEHGVDPGKLTPRLPVDVSTDHSSGVDFYGRKDAFARNLEAEFRRNSERYRLMKWAGTALPGMTVHPPGSGIMHTINLERLSRIVICKEGWAYPETLIGTDSHTPMINGCGILGWGVGGLEAEGALFGVPVTLRIPDVTGVRLTGAFGKGITGTDLALTVTERLRALGVTGDFVEFFGPGMSTLPVGTRACVANMAPEYGASTGYFPMDEATCTYMRMLGRPAADVAFAEKYARASGLWFDPAGEPMFTRSITIDLSAIEPSVAGPRRPQDRLRAGDTARAFVPAMAAPSLADGPAEPRRDTLPDGAVAIAAITSCTNTSDQRMLLAAGLLARKAVRLGLKPPSHVKTSLAPGSPTAGHMLARAGLLAPLEATGFGIVGYGCTTCIGNSGALTPEIASRIGQPGFRPVAVLSGNRNFPGRVHPDLDYGFLASPPMVIAFALAGTVACDITRDALGMADGHPITLADLWPTESEIDEALARALDPADFATAYASAAANPLWAALDAPQGVRFAWDERSTYLRRPPFARAGTPAAISHPARPLLVLGDDMTTDHISPASQIRADSETGRYLIAHGENPGDLNVHASRRGNFEAMLRGAFSNRLARNLLVPDHPAGHTRHDPSGDIVSLTEAARRYANAGVPLVIVAGERYGMGSSRDWAAKAVALLGVRAVLAVSFERIHRTNLIGMGVLPLLLPKGMTPKVLALASGDSFDLAIPPASLAPRSRHALTLHRKDGSITMLAVQSAIETSLEVALLHSGGLIPHVLNGILAQEGRT